MSCLILDVGCLWKKFETKYASWLTCKFTASCQRLISICCKRNAIKHIEYKNYHNYNFGLMTPLWIWQCGFFRPQQQSWTKRKLLLISGRILLCQVCFWRKTLLPYNIPTFKIWRSEVEQCERKRPSPTLMDYSWISAAVVERLVTMNCTKSVSGLELSIIVSSSYLRKIFNHKQRRNEWNFHIFYGCSTPT